MSNIEVQILEGFNFAGILDTSESEQDTPPETPQINLARYRSRLVLPEGIENVGDQTFIQFANEMREQYEILESEFNSLRSSNSLLKNEIMRIRSAHKISDESYNKLINNLTKVISRDYSQFFFGNSIIDYNLNVVLPCYNSKTKRSVNYSNLTKSFLSIFQK